MTRVTKKVGGLAFGAVPKLADAELVLLSGAAKREDGLTEIPSGMKANSVERVVGRHLKRGPAGDSATAEGATGEARKPAEPEAGPDRPREGSKGALVVGLLSRAAGATLDEIIEATGWLPHTSRAALTGLRRRGYAILRDKDESGRTTYRIEVEPPKPVRTGRRRRPQVSAAAAA